ncbi:MAG: MarR family transcriptional regulator [Actinomycetota bacterium]
MTGLASSDVDGHLTSRATSGHAQFREPRGLWQLTPDGRTAHADELVADLDGLDLAGAITEQYAEFLVLNGSFKELCGAWQLKDDAPNDHTDAAYDADVIGRLATLHDAAAPVVSSFGHTLERFGPYAGRLGEALARLRDGDTSSFTGVMCGSYHDVWMELHEDLILSQGIDRGAEGSF